jgi:hypothetical protein
MSFPPQVATKVSISTKIIVTTLLFAGLGALGYASGFVRLDYQSARGGDDAALEECNCLTDCAESRKDCLDAGNSVEQCDQGVGICIDECTPTREPIEPEGDECEDSCRDSYNQCILTGASEQTCVDRAAACMCDCDPTFAPPNLTHGSATNSCVDQCSNQRALCEASPGTPSAPLDCNQVENTCLERCDLWCDDDGREPNDNPTDEGGTCEEHCLYDFDQCKADGTPDEQCRGVYEGCSAECSDDDPKDDDREPQDDPKDEGGTCEEHCLYDFDQCKADGTSDEQCRGVYEGCMAECPDDDTKDDDGRESNDPADDGHTSSNGDGTSSSNGDGTSSTDGSSPSNGDGTSDGTSDETTHSDGEEETRDETDERSADGTR